RQAVGARRGAGTNRRASLLRRPDRGRDRGHPRDLTEHRASKVAGGEGVPAPGAPAADDMTPERWARVQELFAAAVEVCEASPAAFLEGACGQDPELR